MIGTRTAAVVPVLFFTIIDEFRSARFWHYPMVEFISCTMRIKSDHLTNYIKAMRLGPSKPFFTKEKVLVGVLTTPRKGGKYPLPSGKDSRLKEEMVAAAHASGIFMFFFYAEGFDRNTDTVTGHTFKVRNRGEGRWVKAIFDCPNIVYNRLSFRRDEAQNETQELLVYLRNHPKIKIFNPRFLTKWEVHNSLVGSSLTRDMVPETCLFNKNNLGIMLQKYPELFVKPISNSVGKGIIIIWRSQCGNGYRYKLACSDEEGEYCRSALDLYSSLNDVMDPGHKYLIQKSIQLARIDGRVFDLRTQVQKNGRGEWVMSGIGVRVAAPNKYVTHVPNGGTKADYNEVIEKVFGSSPRQLRNLEGQLNDICRTVPYVLEKRLNMNLGILSMDIGLDQNGLMQVIEVNSKPASFDEDHIRRRHLEILNQYFLYLSRS